MVDGGRFRPRGEVTDPERNEAQRQRTRWMRHGDEDGAEATSWPRDISLDASRQSRAVATFRLAGHQPRSRDSALSAKLLTEGTQCDLGARREMIEILGEGVVVKADGEDWLLLGAGQAQPSSSVDSDPK